MSETRPQILEDTNAQLAALEREKAMYEADGNQERAKQVAASIAALKKVAGGGKSTVVADPAPETADA